MSTHTPGPWTIGMSADHTPAIVVPARTNEGSGFCLAQLNRIPRMGSGNMDANAALIAAAPDMLAALKGLLAQNLALAHEIKSSDPLWCKWWDQARAAIAKAEGVS